MESNEDLGNIYRTTKANRTALEDGSPHSQAIYIPSNKGAEMTDKVSRILFPLAFIAYNIFYWNHY